MSRTTAKAEATNPSAKAFSTIPPFAPTFSSLWPPASAEAGAATAVDSVRKMSEIQLEFAQFATERARKNAGTLAAFVTCRSPIDFMNIWRRAAIEAVSDYSEQAARTLESARN